MHSFFSFFCLRFCFCFCLSVVPLHLDVFICSENVESFSFIFVRSVFPSVLRIIRSSVWPKQKEKWRISHDLFENYHALCTIYKMFVKMRTIVESLESTARQFYKNENFLFFAKLFLFCFRLLLDSKMRTD